MKKNILITGSTGFLGYQFLSYALNKGINVTDILNDKHKNNKELNKLKKKYKKNYKQFYFQSYKDFKKLKKKNFDAIINFATFYKDSNNLKYQKKIFEANFKFPLSIINTLKNNCKKFVTFGTMQEYYRSKKFSPKNFYSISKKLFENYCKYLKLERKKIKIYNIKLFETFSKDDKRNKLLPLIIKNYKNSKNIKISKNLKINIVKPDHVNAFLFKIIKKNIPEGSYLIRNVKNTNIKKLIKDINKKTTGKINFKEIENTTNNIFFRNYKFLKNIKIKYDINLDLKNILNENYKYKN